MSNTRRVKSTQYSWAVNEEIAEIARRMAGNDSESKHKGNNCPQAVGCGLMNPYLRRIYVDKNFIRFTDPRTGERYEWDTPDEVYEYVTHWDETNGEHLRDVVVCVDTRYAEVKSGGDRLPKETQPRTSQPKESKSTGPRRTNRMKEYLALREQDQQVA